MTDQADISAASVATKAPRDLIGLATPWLLAI